MQQPSRRALVAGVLALAHVACVTARPPGAGRDPLVIEEQSGGWKAKLGDEQVSQTAAFRAAGFDKIADDEDARRTDGMSWLAGAGGMLLATVGLFAVTSSCANDTSHGSSQPSGGCTAAAIFRWFTATWTLTSGIVATTKLTAPGPMASVAKAAAESYDARLELAKIGVPYSTPARDQEPVDRSKDDRWRLAYAQAPAPLAHAHLGVEGFQAKGRLERLGLDRQAFGREVDALFAQAQEPDAKWERGDFALVRKAEDAPHIFEAAVESCDDAVRYAKIALEPDNRRLLGSARTSLERTCDRQPTPESQVALGDVRQALSQRTGALEAYRKAAQLGPANMEALRALGRSLADNGFAPDAVTLYAGAITKVATDEQRFELLDRIWKLDKKWIHAHGKDLPAGLLPAYDEFCAQREQKGRLESCLNSCYGIQWESSRQLCISQCHAAAGP